MRKAKNVSIIVGFVLVSIATLAGVMIMSGNYLEKISAQKTTEACPRAGASLSVEIKNDKAYPSNISAKICDILKITNSDNTARVIVFGEHSHHIEYDGIAEKKLAGGQNFSIVLHEIGTFKFHDHLQPNVTSNFTVDE